MGPAVALVADPPHLTVRAADQVRLAALHRRLEVHTVDRHGHRVGADDGGAYDVVASVGSGRLPVPVREGVGSYAGVVLHGPQVGAHALRLRHERFETMVHVVVEEGDVAALHVATQPQPITDNRQALAQQPVLVLHDGAGNWVRRPAVAPAAVHATLRPAPAGTAPAAFTAPFSPADAAFAFTDVTVVARHGTDYRLLFRVAAAPALEAISDAVRAQGCGAGQFHWPGAVACEACPEGADCPGGGVETLRPRANFRRCSNGTGTVVRCPAFLADGACQAGGACKAGHGGPLCAVCGAGRAFPSCERCGGVATVLALGFFGALVLLALGWTLLRAAVMTADCEWRLTVSVWKRAVGYFQVRPRPCARAYAPDSVDHRRAPPKGLCNALRVTVGSVEDGRGPWDVADWVLAEGSGGLSDVVEGVVE